MGLGITALHKKWSFPLRISSVNVTKSAGNCGFGQIYWRIPKWKTSFFVQCRKPCLEFSSNMKVFSRVPNKRIQHMLWLLDTSSENQSFESYPQECMFQILFIRVLSHFLLTYIHLKLLVRTYLKRMFLSSWRSWQVLCFKFERKFKNYLLIIWRLEVQKSFLHNFIGSKAFTTSRKNYQICYFRFCLQAWVWWLQYYL